MRRAELAVAAAPLAAALAALGIVAASGFSRRSGLPPVLEERFYGFFLDRYPLYAAAIVYALARLLAVAVRPGRACAARRVAGCAFGIALVLAASLHPTFGGVVLRSGFATGGIAFLQQMPMWAAYGLGAAAAAVSYGSALGAGALATGGRLPLRDTLPRRLLAGAGRAASRLLALWFAFIVLGIAREAGLGPWPRQAMAASNLAVAGGLTLLAFLPHAVLVGLGRGAVTSGP